MERPSFSPNHKSTGPGDSPGTSAASLALRTCSAYGEKQPTISSVIFSGKGLTGNTSGGASWNTFSGCLFRYENWKYSLPNLCKLHLKAHVVKGSLAQKLPIYERHLSKVKSSRVVSSRVVSSRVVSSRVESSRVESSRIVSSRVESSRVESSRIVSSRVESSRVESSRVSQVE